MDKVACVAADSFPFPNAREREENHPRRAPSLARFSFACSISAPPEKGKESAATQAMDQVNVCRQCIHDFLIVSFDLLHRYFNRYHLRIENM